MADMQQTMSATMRGVAPMQQLAGSWLENMERVMRLQLDVAQSYTHFALGQWRDALTIEGPNDLPNYMARQSRAAQELSQRVAQDTREIFEAMRSGSERGLQLVPDAVQRSAEGAGEQMRRGAEQTQRAVRQATEAAERAGDQSGQLPIRDYDELSVSDIEERIEKLDAQQIQALRDYERRNKGRKTLDQAFERRLNA